MLLQRSKGNQTLLQWKALQIQL